MKKKYVFQGKKKFIVLGPIIGSVGQMIELKLARSKKPSFKVSNEMLKKNYTEVPRETSD